MEPADYEESMNPAKFWLVWNREGSRPIVKHPTADAAHKEAERLASQFDGAFVVLESIGEYKKTVTTYSPHFTPVEV